MQLQRHELYEAAALLGYGALFLLWERWRPAHEVRRRDRRRDAFAFVVILVGVYASRAAVMRMVEASGLDAWLAAQPWRHWPKLVQFVIAGLLADLGLYWIHRLMHTRLFWNAHKWHHSAEHLDWFSGLRTSVVHAFLFAVPQVLVAFYLFPFTTQDIGMALAGGIFVQFFTHANVTLPLGPLEYVLVTPQSHRRHHALVEGIAHGNYGSSYAFWDRLFGTYVDHRELPRNYPLGIGERGNAVRMSIGI